MWSLEKVLRTEDPCYARIGASGRHQEPKVERMLLMRRMLRIVPSSDQDSSRNEPGWNLLTAARAGPGDRGVPRLFHSITSAPPLGILDAHETIRSICLIRSICFQPSVP